VKVQIICTKPGMRRNGIEHPASAFYEDGRWSDTQLKAFKGDPNFIVRAVDELAENVNTDADFQLAVSTEVKRQVAVLQSKFDQAVQAALTEKVGQLKADHDNVVDGLGKELKAATDKAAQVALDMGLQLQEANTKITSLEAQLAEARKKPTSTK